MLERLHRTLRTPLTLERFHERGDVMASLPPPWQRLVDSELEQQDVSFVLERFVGVTVRDIARGLRGAQRILPEAVLRACVEAIVQGLGALEATVGQRRPLPLSGASVGLGIDGRWMMASSALNHWCFEELPPEAELSSETVRTPTAATFFLSAEALLGRPETPASLVGIAATFSWGLAAGGFHPFRPTWPGARADTLSTLNRMLRGEPCVPLDVHPGLPRAVCEVLRRGLQPGAGRFANLAAFRSALDGAWTTPAAAPDTIQGVLFGVAEDELRRQLASLKAAPLLPLRWRGVWTGASSPGESVAVLEDQLVERLVPPASLPAAVLLPGINEAPPRPPAVQESPRPPPETELTPPPTGPGPTAAAPSRPPVGLLRRLFGRFGR